MLSGKQRKAMSINSFSDWVQLPEIACPKVADTTKKGAVYKVYKVGFLAISTNDIPLEMRGVFQQAGKYILPTIDLQFGDTRQLCKLPVQLTEWAFDLTATVQYTGKSPFPVEVEFGVLDDRHYAEMI
jgi:hypothetical protein